MFEPIPAPGFRKVSGKRAPKAGKYWVQLGSGWVDRLGPWPTHGPVWTWDGDEPADWEVAAVMPE